MSWSLNRRLAISFITFYTFFRVWGSFLKRVSQWRQALNPFKTSSALSKSKEWKSAHKSGGQQGGRKKFSLFQCNRFSGSSSVWALLIGSREAKVLGGGSGLQPAQVSSDWATLCCNCLSPLACKSQVLSAAGERGTGQSWASSYTKVSFWRIHYYSFLLKFCMFGTDKIRIILFNLSRAYFEDPSHYLSI